ncbi:MAG: hypothetical protein KDJ86_18265 [Bauldia sp.]|uniref:hypothetical protein n=1 Tax=Bauldia sp. TaxID=2575872 RepID=UPI001D4FF9A4|nr:hypothetical protein [Bauldia sp.]MCB1497732.1 hypothetical protein [Bauldia sp.]
MFEMTRFPVAVVGPVVDEFNASHLPYFFRSRDPMYNVVDGEIGTGLPARLEEAWIGLG